ncbi:MAG: TIGR03435 family protein [Terracidiphilus sp.]
MRSSFNCRERALLPPLFLCAMAIAFLVGPRGKASAAAPQQAAPPAATAPAPVFDVAAIHVRIPEPHEHNSIWSSPFDGRFKAENVSVMTLIWWAYEMPEARILGAPAWVNATHFNIEATADPAVDAQLKGLSSDAGRKVKETMIRALLADRFKLVTHTETRELPIYTLVVAKGGPRLGALQDSGTSINRGSDRIEVQTSNSVSTLAEQLSMIVGRDVVDKTGITGRYNLKLQWTPDDDAADSGPSLFTALEEQLGLKLEPAKGPVQVLVIDHAEMPSAN